MPNRFRPQALRPGALFSGALFPGILFPRTLGLLVLCGLLAGWSFDAEAQNLKVLKSAVNQEVRKARGVASELGVHIVEIDTGRDVYSYNADTRRIIASNTKLVSSAAALDRLGPTYFFETPVFLRGNMHGNSLDGDLGVVGGGDPTISGRFSNGDSFAVFRHWAARLKELGIRRIDGDLYLATGFFDDQWVHPDWPKDQLDRWYEAPVASLSFNDNCVLVKAEGVRTVSGNARISLVPALPFYKLKGSVSLTSNPRKEWIRIGRKTASPTAEEARTFEISGRIHRRTEQLDKWVTVANPVTYFGVALRHALLEEGVELTGRVLKVRSLSGSWRQVTVHRSDLLTALEIVNKRSQNFYAEAVTKTLGAETCGEGTWEAGLRTIREFLDEVGLDRSAYSLADGSGMSRNNRFTPRQLTTLLRHMHGHRWSAEYRSTLPVSGEKDLSWEKRLASAAYRDRVWSKTGTLNGVSTLSGYARGRSGKLYAFSILGNRSKANWRSKNAQDAVLRALIDHG